VCLAAVENCVNIYSELFPMRALNRQRLVKGSFWGMSLLAQHLRGAIILSALRAGNPPHS
jgi:hypothetical protein